MGLSNLEIKDSYRSDRNDLLRDFYIPCIEQSVSYDRAVGYFTSTSLMLAAQGVNRLAQRRGRMRIIASPQLTDSDAQEIAAGYEYRQVVSRALMRQLDGTGNSEVSQRRLGLLGRLIAEGLLEVKIAFVVRDGQVGIYHEKIAVFTDEDGNSVATVGSSNETKSAYLANFESFEVYRSWHDADQGRLARVREDFELLWDDETQNLRVLDFPEAARERMLEIAESQPGARVDMDGGPLNVDSQDAEEVPRIWDGQREATAGLPVLPSWLELRTYQEDAISSWMEANGRGIWQMATGTGKTLTALCAMTRVFDHLQAQSGSSPLVVLVVVPYQHLVDQWVEEFSAFGVKPLACMDDRSSWMPQLQAAQATIRNGKVPFMAIVATNRTFSLPAFQEVFNPSGGIFMFIGDEAHNLGSPALRAVLPEKAHYRLGLSATPDRWYDDEGSESLNSYFGPVAFNLGMREALEIGALTPYRYHPVVVPLDEEEHSEYVALSYEISKLVASGDDEVFADKVENQRLKMLLIERSRILGRASGKLPALQKKIEEFRDSWFQLVYCAEVSVEDEDGVPQRQIDAVAKLIGRDLRLANNIYVSDTSRAERRELLRRFSTGDDLRFLVSMRCLDEGVDVPDARVAYLIGSSTNPRQFIQRRGRILRRSPGKSSADIIDFIAVPPEAPESSAVMKIERRLMQRELARVTEFASLAINGPEAMGLLLDLRRRYGLLKV